MAAASTFDSDLAVAESEAEAVAAGQVEMELNESSRFARQTDSKEETDNGE